MLGTNAAVRGLDLGLSLLQSIISAINDSANRGTGRHETAAAQNCSHYLASASAYISDDDEQCGQLLLPTRSNVQSLS